MYISVMFAFADASAIRFLTQNVLLLILNPVLNLQSYELIMTELLHTLSFMSSHILKYYHLKYGCYRCMQPFYYSNTDVFIIPEQKYISIKISAQISLTNLRVIKVWNKTNVAILETSRRVVALRSGVAGSNPDQVFQILVGRKPHVTTLVKFTHTYITQPTCRSFYVSSSSKFLFYFIKFKSILLSIKNASSYIKDRLF